MLPHPYCRTCGSIIQDKSVCQSCGCEPLKGKHYCCDCGTSTVSEAIMCVECGAGFQRRFPATLAILIAGALIVAIAGAVYVLSQSIPGSSAIAPPKSASSIIFDSSAISIKQAYKKSEIKNTIVNHIPFLPSKIHKDSIVAIKNNAPKNIPPNKVAEAKTVVTNKEKVSAEEVPGKNLNVISTNVFSVIELRTYRSECSYFEGRSKGNVIFFTNNVFGYIKINGKLYELKGMEKGSDIAKFTGAGFEVTIEIEGLSGNENQWLASATLVVKDMRQKIISRHRVYSSCTEF